MDFFAKALWKIEFFLHYLRIFNVKNYPLSHLGIYSKLWGKLETIAIE